MPGQGEAVKFELAGEYDRETDELQVWGLLAPFNFRHYV